MNFTFYFKESYIIDHIFSAKLTYFTHKRPYLNGPTKATATLHIIKNNKVIDEINLSIHGIQGKTQKEDGLSEKDRYSLVIWNNYLFQLTDFKYGESISVNISKKIKD